MKARIVSFMSYFLIVLFVYAAVSKLIVFQDFQVQLTQSPLLSAYANLIAYLVILVELVISVLLAAKKTRLVGLYLSYLLMVAFSLYIYLILNYSDFIPCSCGGVLESLSWNEHLWFNIIVCCLTITAAYLLESNYKRFWSAFILTTIIGSGLVISAFLSSEHIIKKENPFIRRYVPHPINFVKEYDLGMNSYYLVGKYNDSIVLGNKSAPLYIGLLPIDLDTLIHKKIKVVEDSIRYRTSQIVLWPPYFYILDGYIPFIYKGSLSTLEAWDTESKAYFSLGVPISENKIFIRTRSSDSQRDILGVIRIDEAPQVNLADQLLDNNSDGFFETDGKLLYNAQNDKVIYSYYYKNEYLVFNSNLSFFKKSNTIYKKNIELDIEYRDGIKKLTNPFLILSKNASTYGDILLLQSNIRGENETFQMWNKSSVIDVYNFMNNTYVFSFYIPHRDTESLSQFLLTKTKLLVLQGSYLQIYDLDPAWFSF